MRRVGLVVVIAALAVPLACVKQGPSEPEPGVLAAHDPPPDDSLGDDAQPDAGEAGTAAGGEAGTPDADPSADASTDASPPSDPAATAPAPATGEPAPPKPEPQPAALPKVLHGKVDASCGKDDGVGQKLKSFALQTVDGKPVSHKSWKGRVLLVNFWGTWCKPCLKELPEFEQLYRRYKKHGLTLVAIATDEDPAPVKEYVDARKISAKVVIGAEDYAGQYGSPKFPFTFVVDTKGVIRASFRGYRPECIGKVEAEVRRELEARAGAG
ncbi:MAG TPA: TlpA disulfide reductase family protein [Nannocystaceae bacterium]|nr:TlpA disulfide reductase family protein [Nannocystaceae bacterium]